MSLQKVLIHQSRLLISSAIFILGIQVSSASEAPADLAYTAPQKQCLATQYQTYVNASLTWYQALVTQVTSENERLDDVGEWFLTGRQHHFALNQAAFTHFLETNSKRITLDNGVESWLVLTQQDIQALSQQDSSLGKVAKQTFDDRQAPNHPQNYQLREAIAHELSQTTNMQAALDDYNASVSKISKESCL